MREVPPGFRVLLDPTVRRHAGGRVLIGGAPLRVLRLSETAAGLLDHLGQDRRRARVIARALLDAGLAHPHLEPAPPRRDQVTVIVPARDRAAALARCLDALGSALCVLVVDDASVVGEAVARVAAGAGATLLPRTVNGGPAAARNTGLTACSTPFVAFVDSDCRPDEGWLERLLPHFTDPSVAAVAPRVVAEATPGWIGAYEHVRSRLDLGPRAAHVAPGSRVSYVPAAALVVRCSAFGQGFDEQLRVGEDVDLVWRLHRAGWTVRYEPAAWVRHASRPSLRPWLGQRFAYGGSAAPLGKAHPGAVAPVVVSPWSLAAWGALVAGHPGLAAAILAAASARLARRLPMPSGRAFAGTRLVGLGTLAAGRSLARAAVREWWPLTVAASLASRRARAPLAAAALLPPVLAFARLHPEMSPLAFVAAHIADDAAYGLGVWWGCWRHRTVEPLLPRRPSAARA